LGSGRNARKIARGLDQFQTSGQAFQLERLAGSRYRAIGVSDNSSIYATLDVASDLEFCQILDPPDIGLSALDAAEGVPAAYTDLMASARNVANSSASLVWAF